MQLFYSEYTRQNRVWFSKVQSAISDIPVFQFELFVRPCSRLPFLTAAPLIFLTLCLNITIEMHSTYFQMVKKTVSKNVKCEQTFIFVKKRIALKRFIALFFSYEVKMRIFNLQNHSYTLDKSGKGKNLNRNINSTVTQMIHV